MRRFALLITALLVAVLVAAAPVHPAHAAGKPVPVTLAATGVTSTSAVLNGTVNPNCKATTAEFDWGLTTSYGTLTPPQSMGSGCAALPISATITGLTPATTYHFRVKAANHAGTVYAAGLSFTTGNIVFVSPVVTTGSATGVTSAGATLNGTVNPEGQATTCHFDWGTTTAYGSATPDDASPGSGNSAVPVSATISGLTASTGYHFRLGCSNAAGGALGSDAAFTTSAGGENVLSRNGTTIMDGAAPWRGIGLNVWGAAISTTSPDNVPPNSSYAVNDGTTLADTLASIKAGCPRCSVIRAWFFQQFALPSHGNPAPSLPYNWSAFDKVLTVADASGFRVVPVLFDQWNWERANNSNAIDASWYTGGYSTTVEPYEAVPYRQYVNDITAHYAGDPRIAWWELVNEPDVAGNGSCPANAGSIASSFVSDITGLMKANDPAHMTDAGTAGQVCGFNGADYSTVNGLSTVDICSHHDYTDPANAGGTWGGGNGLDSDSSRCAALGKPVYVGEEGIQKSVGLSTRAADFNGKFSAQFGYGNVAGITPWSFRLDNGGDGYTWAGGDPSLPVLNNYALPSAGFVTRSGGTLQLGGSQYKFVGFNAYGLATCDGLTYTAADLDAFFAAVKPTNSVIRFWATQKATAAQINLVIARAQADGVKVNPTLIDGPNNCNAAGQTVDASFVAQTGTTWTAYLAWIDTVVTPFAPGGAQAANAPAIAFWGICNECDSYANTPAQMQAMNETAAARIKADDPSNLVSAGTAGNKSSSCNQTGTNFQTCEAAADLDVMEIHEYQYDQSSNTGVHTSWDGVYLPASVTNGRPLIVGETGANLNIPSNNLCHTTPDTTIDQLAQQKYAAYMGDGAAGVMVWNWMKSQPGWVGNGCVGQDFFFGPSNSVLAVEKNFVIP
jgi:endo-1,4-beta-mannosidase